MNKLVVFDIDGVLRDFEGALIELLAVDSPVMAYRKRHLYSFYDRFEGFPTAIALMEECVADPSFYRNLVPIVPMVMLAFGAMQEFDVIFLSSCPQKAWRNTVLWLRERGLDVSNDQVYCGVKDKAAWLKSYLRDGQEVEFVVEDSPENIHSLQSAGFKTYAWNQPWNEGCFPRLEVNRDGDLMVWATESTESFLFEDLYAEA